MLKQNKTTILIVDDSSTNNLLFENILETEGYKVLAASSGSEALHILQSKFPNLILLDVMMAGMDGFEVLKNIIGSEKLKQIPVVMVTAKKDSESMKKALELGAKDYLIKPIGIEELLSKVKSLLAKS
jgi:CheY-like chemotaxis protein